MKLKFKPILWVVGGLLLIGVFSNSNSSNTAVRGTQTTVVPTVEATSTPIPTLEPTATNTPAPTIYIAPTSIPTPIPAATTQSSGLSNDNYYTNVDGNEVHSPAYSDTVPAGASAICRDGTYSFSQNRRGTCSGHGGVSQWL